jgi:hypothetical protein
MKKIIYICLVFCFCFQFVSAKSFNVLPSVENLNKSDLQQSLSIEEHDGSVLCDGMINCPEFNESNITINIKNGKVVEINNDYLKVLVFNKEYVVFIKDVSLVDYYWGSIDLKSFILGDVVNIFGVLDGENVYAKSVRNVSLKSIDVYFGEIEFISSEKILLNEDKFNINEGTRFLSNNKVLSLEEFKEGKYVVVRVIDGYAISIALKEKPINIPIVKDIYPGIKNSVQTPFNNMIEKIKGFGILKNYFSR